MFLKGNTVQTLPPVLHPVNYVNPEILSNDLLAKDLQQSDFHAKLRKLSYSSNS